MDRGVCVVKSALETYRTFKQEILKENIYDNSRVVNLRKVQKRIHGGTRSNCRLFRYTRPSV